MKLDIEAENQQLKQQLADTQTRLEGIQKLLGVSHPIASTQQYENKTAIQERESELNELHERLMLGTRHNATVRKEQILQKIQRQYLGVNDEEE